MPTATGKRRSGRPFSKPVSTRRRRSSTKVVGGGGSTVGRARGRPPAGLGAPGAASPGAGRPGGVAGTTGRPGGAKGAPKPAGAAPSGPPIWSGSGPPSRAAAPGVPNGGGGWGLSVDVMALAGWAGAEEPADADGCPKAGPGGSKVKRASKPAGAVVATSWPGEHSNGWGTVPEKKTQQNIRAT
jgi:hypothetical protein